MYPGSSSMDSEKKFYRIIIHGNCKSTDRCSEPKFKDAAELGALHAAQNHTAQRHLYLYQPTL